jgi:LysM repeat protein
LAKTVLPMPSTPVLQRDLEQVADQNRRLHEELEECRARYAALTNRVTNPGLASGARAAQKTASPIPAPRSDNQQSTANPGASVAVRTHKVQAGESPISIARKYGVKLESLMAANPGLNPKRLQIGQTLNIPPS